MRKAKILYDIQEDILSVSKDKMVKHSTDVGDFIIDFDSEGIVCGIEILNASENMNMKSEDLNILSEISIVTTYRTDAVYVSIFFKSENKEKEIKIPINFKSGFSKKEDRFCAVA